MIIEVEDRFCKVVKQFSRVLAATAQAAKRGDAVHEVEETTWGGLIEVGREMIAAYVKQQDEKLPRPKVIEHEGKTLRRLPKRRTRKYVSVFGPTPFRRHVYATRETQRQEVVPLDAKLGMPEGHTSYLLQKWGDTNCVKESYQESRASLLEILGFAPSVNCLEDTVARAAEHAKVYFDEQEPIDPTTEEEILVATSDCKGVPMRRTVVAIMDGETKLRNLQELKIGRAVGILDIWHVTEYLWKLAYCFHSEGSDEAEAFVETYLGKLLEGKVRRVIGGIRQMATKRRLSKRRWEKVEQYLNYFTRRCEHMKYDEYLAAGYPIGSGVVEGACRHLVKDRMEQSGMRWRIEGAQAVLSLRAIYLNDDWNAFYAARIQAEQRKLYPYKPHLPTILNCAT